MAVKFAVDNPITLHIPKLDMQTLHVSGFSDSSFAKNHDSSTLLGHIIFLADNYSKALATNFKSYKSKRVIRSPMAGEVIAFSDMFDAAATLASELSHLYRKDIPQHLFMDSKSLFDVISKGSRRSEKRLMLDIAAAREGFQNKVISNVGFVRCDQNMTDGLTQAMKQKALQNVISIGELNVQPEQWILRQ